MLACASFSAIGWPSWRTLWMVMRPLKVWTSSAKMGCLWIVGHWESPVSREDGYHPHFHSSPERLGGLVVPGIYDACSHMFPCHPLSLTFTECGSDKHTFWGGLLCSRISRSRNLREPVETVPMLVALRMLIVSSASCLTLIQLSYRLARLGKSYFPMFTLRVVFVCW